MSLSVLTIPDGLQLAEVNGHGPVPSEVETVEGTVQLQLVNNSEDDVIIVTELICIKLGIEHPYSAFRGSRIETSLMVSTIYSNTQSYLSKAKGTRISGIHSFALVLE